MFFVLRIRRTPRSTVIDTLVPYTTLFRSVKGLKGDQRNPTGLKAVRALVEQYQPDALVIEDCAAKGARRSERIRRLYRSIEALAASQVIEVHRYSRAQLRQCFDEGFGAWRKQEIAQTIATLLPDLAHRLPPVENGRASCRARGGQCVEN